ncbi:hypothetical protein [Actinophytocola xanthii]|uniref:hypothetical protein n=1 Tax=Actinophytocola xanthii TaxID=1912961 RepID=UPI0018E92987|nr:hypothetical protein [Actinophytocola xanthii]
MNDRDGNGVLWFRMPSRPGQGRPLFTKVHPQRQRQAMRRLLCGVCGQPADQNADGTLWLLCDFRGDWPDWPERMAVTEPPVCRPCVRVASRLCPALRNRCVAVRARRAPVAGVWGALYRSGGHSPPVPVGDVSIAYGDPAIRWVRAFALLRELHECVILDVDTLCPESTAG